MIVYVLYSYLFVVIIASVWISSSTGVLREATHVHLYVLLEYESAHGGETGTYMQHEGDKVAPPTHNPRPTAHMRHNPQYRPPSGPRARPRHAAVARV